MKTRLTLKVATVLLSILTLNVPLSTALAQGTAFIYQGELREGGRPASGIYDLRFAIYDSTNNPGVVIAGPISNAAVAVSNGLFAVTLDFGAGVFAGAPRWLEVGVRTNGGSAFATLDPRQPITSAPYAIRALDAGNAVSATVAHNVSMNAVATGGLQNNSITSEKIINGAIAAEDLAPGLLSGTFWRLDGNAGTTPGTLFLGTTDDQPLDLRVNNERALRLMSTRSNDTVNVLAGSPLNYIDPDLISATIAGGGTPSFNGVPRTNSIGSDFATVGGGADNHIGTNSNSSIIAGGYGHRIADNGFDNTIGGGSFSSVGTNTSFATIGGGTGNRIGTNSNSSVISGGFDHRIGDDTFDGTIGGGSFHRIGSNSWYSTIAGGHQNVVSNDAHIATIGGGRLNTILKNLSGATIAGGQNNTANRDYPTVSGGLNNTADGNHASVGGGINNNAINANATVGGGTGNTATGVSATVAGGNGNSAIVSFACVGGGSANEASGSSSTVCGGGDNTASGSLSTVPGGSFNVAGGNFSLAAGRRAKANHDGAFVWADSQDADFASQFANQFRVRATGGARFDVNSDAWIELRAKGSIFVPPLKLIDTSTGAYLSQGGAWVDSSDRNRKENFEPVRAEEILAKVAAIPITTWNYIAEERTIRHIGPVAQDFHAAFGVGADEKHLAALDANGVALAAIQGLNRKLEQKEAEITELRQTVNVLKELVQAMNLKVNGGDQ